MTGGNPLPSDRSLSQVSVTAINPLITFGEVYGKKRSILFSLSFILGYSFILSWTPHDPII
jgi:hypothetical protein